MKFGSILKEGDISQDQRSFALSQQGISTSKTISPQAVETKLIKDALIFQYKPTEFSVGVNGNIYEVDVDGKNISGSFKDVIVKCIDIVTKGK